MQIANASDFDTSNQSSMDDTLLVRFYLKPRQDAGESAKQGRPVFVDKEYIEIRIPGSRDAVARPASPADIARFPKHYEAFKNRTAEPETGTPLIEWPAISRSMAEEFSFFNVKTVEQLIDMSDQNAGQFMGINELKRKAKKWLEAADTSKAEEAIQKRDDEIAELKAQVKELMKLAKPKVTKKRRTKKVGKKKAVKKEE